MAKALAGIRREQAWPLAGGILAGIVMDAVLGDPRRGHPVAAFGRAAQGLQDRIYRDSVLCGAGYAALSVLAAMAPGVLARHLTRRHPWLRLAATAAAAWTVTGAASLASEANTLDSMVGYRSARYARFGWASARLDDIVNWAPARLTGLLAGALAGVAGRRPKLSWQVMRSYGSCHPSPNAGRCEAAFAGALGIRLGGTSAYAGVTEQRPSLGDGRAPEPADIARAVRLCRAMTAAAAVGAAAAALMTGRGAGAAGRLAQ